jgi:hypothetical protein
MAGLALGRGRAEGGRGRPPRGYWREAFSRLIRSRSGLAGLIIVGLLVLLGVLGRALAPWDYRVQDL